MKDIKNIIFDLGGVIINLDMPLSYQRFARLAAVDAIPEYSYEQQHQVFKDFEVGAITSQQFVDAMRQMLNPALSDQAIIDAWNAMLLDIPAERLDLLKNLKAHFNTYLFSNTNAIHYAAFNQYVADTFQQPSLDSYFNKTYYSHLMGMRKPDVAAFQRILDENGLLASETLFLDDTEGHFNGASQLGIQTQLVTPEHGILEIFSQYT